MSTFHTSLTWKRVREAAVFRWYSDGCPPCALCGQAIEDERPVVDHKVPVTDGGAKYDLDNLRCVHSKCNSQRDRGGTSYSARRRRARKIDKGWQPEPPSVRAGLNGNGRHHPAHHSRDWFGDGYRCRACDGWHNRESA